MPSTIRFSINNTAKPQTLTAVVGSGNAGKPLVIASQKGALYSILDTETGFAPHNILIKRVGNNLTIAFSKKGNPDIIIENFYKDGNAGLVGLAENGEYYYYVPESGQRADFIPHLGDNSPAEWHALGPIENGSGFPWMLIGGGLALGALAGAGGGGGSGGDNTPKTVGAPTIVINDGGDELLNAQEIAHGVTATITLPQDAKAGYTLTVDTNGDGSADHNIKLTDADIRAGKVTVTIAPAHIPANGVLTATALITDTEGNKSPQASDTSHTDSIAPTIKITEAHHNENDTVHVTGTTEAGATVIVTFPDGSTVTTTADTNGGFSVDSAQPQVSQTITAVAHDPAGNTSAPDSITINDPATVTAASGTVTEDDQLIASGTISVDDPDVGEALVQAQTNTAGQYGTFNVDANGHWSYQLNNDLPAIQALTTTTTLTETFTVTSKDGSGSNTVTITIQGKDDTATVAIDPNHAKVETWYENVLNSVVNTTSSSNNLPIHHALDTLGITITDLDGASDKGYTLNITESASGWFTDSTGKALAGDTLTLTVHNQSDLEAQLAQYFYQPAALTILSDNYIPDAPLHIALNDNGTVSTVDYTKIVVGQTDTAIEISSISSHNFTGEYNDTVVVTSSATGGTMINAGDGNDTIKLQAVRSIAFGGDGNDIIVAQSTEHEISGGNGNDTIYVLSHAQASNIASGAGSDAIWFSAHMADTANSNTLKDFDIGADKLNFFDAMDSNGDNTLDLYDLVASVTSSAVNGVTSTVLTFKDTDNDGIAASITLNNMSYTSIDALVADLDITVMGNITTP